MLVPDNDKNDVALTDKQQTFLDALFGEAQGDPKVAGEIAKLIKEYKKASTAEDKVK